jgi:cell division protein FtsI/penicillin-binding protein 2
MKLAGFISRAAALYPLALGGIVWASSFDALPRVPERPEHAAARPEPPAPVRPPPETLDLARQALDPDGRYRAPTSRGRRVALTLDAALQGHAEHVLGEADAALGAVVIMGTDGRILALAGRSEATGDRVDLALDPWAPSASVFKIVTAAALVDAGLGPGTRVCIHDGAGGLTADNLVDDARKDDVCATLAYGLARSNNAVLGKLAVRHLTSDVLADAAARFGYGRELPLFGTAARADIPTEPLELARAAAGFWHTELSPLGGALVAATVASGGLAVTPYITDDGPAPARRVLKPETARAVADMLVGTTDFGTARTAFHDASGRPFLRVPVAGKTGTLSRRPVAGLMPLDFSWFVGFAPADHPAVVVAVLLGNHPRHHLRAATCARMVLEQALARRF